MKIFNRNTPWSHKVIDNFLVKRDFEELTSMISNIKSDVGRNQRLIHNIISDGKINENLFPIKYHDLINRMSQRFESFVHSDCSVPDKPYKINIDFVCLGLGFMYPPYTDSEDTFSSLILYAFPDIGDGSVLHNNLRKPIRTIDWKHNRAFFFERGQEKFHSYKNVDRSKRVTINFNIVIDEKRV